MDEKVSNTIITINIHFTIRLRHGNSLYDHHLAIYFKYCYNFFLSALYNKPEVT